MECYSAALLASSRIKRPYASYIFITSIEREWEPWAGDIWYILRIIRIGVALHTDFLNVSRIKGPVNRKNSWLKKSSRSISKSPSCTRGAKVCNGPNACSVNEISKACFGVSTYWTQFPKLKTNHQARDWNVAVWLRTYNENDFRRPIACGS